MLLMLTGLAMLSYNRQQIAGVFDFSSALAAVKESFRLYSNGHVTSPPVAHLGFAQPPGDYHIKAAHVHGKPVFAVKISNGFYENPAQGLASSNGAVLLFCAKTGSPLALLEDQGLITNIRTALAGVVATSLARTESVGAVGVIGTGTQARLQLQYLYQHKGPFPAWVWGRSPAAVEIFIHAEPENRSRVL